MEEDEDIFLITGDLGFGMFDAIRDRFPERFYNVGSAEQLMMQTAVGLSLSGKKPITYTISPFYWRCAEMIRNYVNHEGIPILMVGSGVDKDYAHDGFSHDACDIVEFFEMFRDVNTLPTGDIEELQENFEDYNWEEPWFLNLKR